MYDNNMLLQDEALYVAMKLNYVDVIEGLLINGANSNICDDVSCLFEITKLMSLQFYVYFTALFINHTHFN